MTLSVSQDSLALVAISVMYHGDVCAIRVMREYAEAESWSKQYHIALPTGLVVTEGDGTVLLRRENERLVLCDMENMRVGEVEARGDSWSRFGVIDSGEEGEPSLTLDDTWLEAVAGE